MTSDEKSEDHVLAQFLQPERLSRLESVLDARTKRLTVVLDNVKNSHNVSAVLRSADAFGVAEVHLVGERFTYSPSISQGTERWMQLRKHESADTAIEHLQKEGFKIVVLQPQEHSEKEGKLAQAVSMLPFEEKLALVFGNEGLGVQNVFREAADICAYIPMYGFVESLNISVACAICLYSATIASSKPGLRGSRVNGEQREELKDAWLKNSVRNCDIILREIETRQDEE